MVEEVVVVGETVPRERKGDGYRKNKCKRNER
jgi:hypothetical protein